MHFTRSGKHSSILLQQFKEAIRLGSVLRSRRLCNIRIHLSPIGVLILSRKNKKMPYSDVYMLAKAKNRLNDIFKIYTILKDNNLKPNLLLAGVDIQDQKYKDEITYLNKSIPYEENLQYIFHTHCILEVMQKNGIGFTQRACEAVCLGKNF